jgi:hypothetical protein
MKQDQFLVTLESRLRENKKIAENSWLPGFLKPLASYLAFNTFRALFVLSLVMTVGMIITNFSLLMEIGRRIFFY